MDYKSNTDLDDQAYTEPAMRQAILASLRSAVQPVHPRLHRLLQTRLPTMTTIGQGRFISSYEVSTDPLGLFCRALAKILGRVHGSNVLRSALVVMNFEGLRALDQALAETLSDDPIVQGLIAVTSYQVGAGMFVYPWMPGLRPARLLDLDVEQLADWPPADPALWQAS